MQRSFQRVIINDLDSTYSHRPNKALRMRPVGQYQNVRSAMIVSAVIHKMSDQHHFMLIFYDIKPALTAT